MLAATRPGVIVVAGEPEVGTSRLAREAAGRLALDGTVVVEVVEPGPGLARLRSALAEAGHPPDAAMAGRLRPIVILLGDRRDEPHLAAELTRRLAGSRALVLLTAHRVTADAPTIVLRRLDHSDSALLARVTSPGLEHATSLAIGALGDGLPGRIVPLALEARDWPGGESPLPIPDSMRAWAHRSLGSLAPWARDLAGWVAVVSDPITPQELARVCREGTVHIEHGLDALVRAGILDEIAPPPVIRWTFRDRIVRAVAAADLGGAELRRRHAAALVAARAAGDHPAELLRHALGAVDPPAVLMYATRAAQRARSQGGPEAALAYARQALSWWGVHMDGGIRLAALHESGMAMLDLSAWADAAES